MNFLFVVCFVFQSVKRVNGAWLVLNHVLSVRMVGSVTKRMEPACVHLATLETSVRIVSVGTAVIFSDSAGQFLKGL